MFQAQAVNKNGMNGGGKNENIHTICSCFKFNLHD